MRCLAIFLILAFGPSAKATDIFCSGIVTDVYVSSFSGLFIKPDWGGWKRLCNVNGTHNSIDAETCNAWLSLIQVSMAADKKIKIKLSNASGDCASQLDNSSFPKPVYVRLEK